MTKKKENSSKSTGFKSIRKVLLWLALSLIAVSAYFAYILFAPNISPRNADDTYLYIHENSSYNDVLNMLEKDAKVFNLSAFRQVSKMLQYGTKIHAGRYAIEPGTSNFRLVRALRSGRQKPLNLTFNNIRTKEQLAGRLGKQLMADSSSIISLLNDTAFLDAHDLNPNTSIALFIPNTYEVFWDLTAEELFERMEKEYCKFWNDERTAKAASIPLTPVEVSTLASIVEEETNSKKERPIVAGLYINRLKTGMPLQADPTVKFAVGDFNLRRILFGHLKSDSPYNTYIHTGLPPGPIRVASPNGIDAVLNFSRHDYIYMCASDKLNGEHEFARTWEEHLVNARRYRKVLEEKKIF